ncbi:MAG: hypothetical protein MRY64_07050 [Hyphomonadaceae bacterium]|nr:hypothetical protein [Hyphomonadaceae bacterium]
MLLVRATALLVTMGSIGPASYADYQTSLLEIVCNPEISRFSVRAVTTWAWDAEFADPLVPIHEGIDNEQIANNPDDVWIPYTLATCFLNFGDAGYSGIGSGRIEIEVVRTRYIPPSDQGAGGAVRGAQIEVRANGAVVANGFVHGLERTNLPSIEFNNGYLQVCSRPSFYSVAPASETDSHGAYSQNCRLADVREFAPEFTELAPQ